MGVELIKLCAPRTLSIQIILEKSHYSLLYEVEDVLWKQFEISPHILVTFIVYFDFLCYIQQSKMRGRHHNKRALFTNIRVE